MKAIVAPEPSPLLESETAQARFLALECRPLFLADWRDVLFIHFELDPRDLQSAIPFELDVLNGRAHVSLVAFTMRRLRPALGGGLTAWPFRLLGDARFLNVRTYVRHAGEAGIYFMKEFISCRLSAPLGPSTYGLPYHLANLDYRRDAGRFRFMGRVARKEGGTKALEFEARFGGENATVPAELDSDTATFLTEKYTAYTCHRGKRRLFRVWHAPWPLRAATIQTNDHGLLGLTGDWHGKARCLGAHFSRGVDDVWMGRPHRTQPRRTGRAVPRTRRHTAFLEFP